MELLVMRELVKNAIDGICIFINLPFLLLYLLCIKLGNANQVIASFSQFYSLIPGLLGRYLRANFYRFTLTNCSPRVVISFASLFSQTKMTLEEGVYIGPQCNIGSCSVGRNTLIGSGVHIMSGKGQHNFSDLDTPIKDQGGEFTQIDIGEDCWLGNGALVMANIGKQCVVAAGSVVIDDVPDYAIVAGNPAKVIKMRK